MGRVPGVNLSEATLRETDAVNIAQYVQYGCGFCAPAGWTNFDASPSLRLQKLPLLGRLGRGRGPEFPANVLYGDIVRGLPVEPHSCRAVYCSHVLEHLSLTDFRVALRNTRTLLRDRGIFRLVVPDLRAAAERLVADQSAAAAMTFMTETSLGVMDRRRTLGGFMRSWLGNSQHLWMWDFQSLRHELETVGFREIRRARCGDSEESRFAAVEEESRWTDAIGLQCVA
jgi:hypothetical protein